MFPFDRLVRAMDELVRTRRVEDEVFAQIGSGQYEPRTMRFQRYLEKDEFEDLLGRADVVVSHAGIGSIATALRTGKPLVVLPRLKRYAEHVNDHQVGTARRYEMLGHVVAAYSESELCDKLSVARHFTPVPRHADASALARRIGRYLDGQLASRRG